MKIFLALALVIFSSASFGSDGASSGVFSPEAVIFALMLVCIGIFYKKTVLVTLLGLASLLGYKIFFTTGFDFLEMFRADPHTGSEGAWKTYLNLALMLPGFAVLAETFSQSKFPDILPRYLPKGQAGAAALLIFVFILSSFLDNIAAAMIGGSLALSLFKNKVHIGYMAAICAASNAGGAGSVVGDTTTTLIWIDGKDPLMLALAYIPAIVGLLFIAFFASSQQQKYSPFTPAENVTKGIDLKKLLVVILILAFAITANSLISMPSAGIWLAILIGMLFTKLPLNALAGSVSSTVFLVAIVMCADLVPIDSVPDASASVTFALGVISSVFNNIPLTELCLVKGGFDWPLISYAVGFGGSMMWFGSSAGVAICDQCPKARSVINWLRFGWHIPVAFTIGFAVYLAVFGYVSNFGS